jgi:RNA-binding protein YlmH
MPVACGIVPICGRIQSHVIVCAAAAATISLSLQQIPRRDLKIEETRGDEPVGPTEEEPAFRESAQLDIVARSCSWSSRRMSPREAQRTATGRR